jgi:hypothetical protein
VAAAVAISTAAETFHVTPVRRQAVVVAAVAISTAAATFHVTSVPRRAVVAAAAVVGVVRAASPMITGISKAVSLGRRRCEERKRRHRSLRVRLTQNQPIHALSRQGMAQRLLPCSDA